MHHTDLDPAEVARAAAGVAALGSITFVTDGTATTYRTSGETFVVDHTPDGDTTVELSAAAFDDFRAQMRTFINLFLADELTITRGSFEALADWDPALKLLHAGIPIYDPSRADLAGFDPAHTYAPDDDDQTMRDHLAAVGFLHVRGVFSAAEMRELNDEVDRLAALARPGDDHSWWVADENGTDVLCRLVYPDERSPLIASYNHDTRIRRFGTLLDPRLRTYPDRMEGTSVLLKVPGKTSGLSNIPWHQDCGMGGHAVFCPAAAVGVQLTGSSAETGNLLAVPGSHGQTLHYRWEDRLDGVPVVAIDTDPGDITVHVQDVMHASPEPTGHSDSWRRTMYLTHYPPKLVDHIGPGQAFNDIVRNRMDDAARLQ